MNLYLGRIWSCQVVKAEGKLWMMDPAPKGMRSPESMWLPLPRAEAPESTQLGDILEVFIYLDTHDKPIATTAQPKVLPGEAAFLKVVDSTPFGYFVDWGLPRDLFVPFREALGPMEVGEIHAVSPYIDDTERLAGTCRLSQLLEPDEYEPGDKIDGVIWRHEAGVGVFVILERHALALIPATEPCRLPPGTAAQLRVSRVQDDGKVEVSLRDVAHQALTGDARLLMDYLARPNVPRLGDDSSPAQVTARLGISKKALKRAAGHLLKQGALILDDDGYYQVVPEGQRKPRRSRPYAGPQAPAFRNADRGSAPPSGEGGRGDERRRDGRSTSDLTQGERAADRARGPAHRSEGPRASDTSRGGRGSLTPESRSEARTVSRPGTRSDWPSDTRPDTRFESRSDTRFESRSDTRLESRTEARPPRRGESSRGEASSDRTPEAGTSARTPMRPQGRSQTLPEGRSRPRAESLGDGRPGPERPEREHRYQSQSEFKELIETTGPRRREFIPEPPRHKKKGGPD